MIANVKEINNNNNKNNNNNNINNNREDIPKDVFFNCNKDMFK